MLTQRIRLCMFADDVVLLAQSLEDAQGMCDAADAYSRKWRLWFNTKRGKSEVCVFTPGRRRAAFAPDRTLTLGTRELLFTSEYKYLGMATSARDLVAPHVRMRAHNYRRAVNYRVVRHGHTHHTPLPVSIRALMSRLYCSTGLEYALGVWGPCVPAGKLRELEKLQTDAARKVLWAGRLPTSAAVRSELGWIPMRRRIQEMQLRFYARIRRMAPTRLPRMVFEARVRQEQWVQLRPTEWIRQLHTASEELGVPLDHETVTLRPRNPRGGDAWHSLVAQACHSRAVQDFEDAVETSPSTVALATFSHTIELRPYLSGSARPDMRPTRAQLQLRMGCATLRGAGNRHARPPVVNPDALPGLQRCCSACYRQTGHVVRESELHVVTDCVAYNRERDAIRAAAEAIHVPWSGETLGRMVFGDLSGRRLLVENEINPRDVSTVDVIRGINQLLVRITSKVVRDSEDRWRREVLRDF